MNSFNVYRQTETKVGGNTPVWLGTVKPIPVGAKIDGGVEAGDFIPAGTLVNYNAETKMVSTLALDISDEANGYLYNDIRVGTDVNKGDVIDATCAVVMHHPEGLLIERVYPEITEEQIAQLQAKIPGVLLVRG